MFETFRNLFKSQQQDSFVNVTAGDNTQKPTGWFRAIWPDKQELGYHSSNVTFLPAGNAINHTVVDGSQRITLQIPEDKTYDEVFAALPPVYMQRRPQAGVHHIGNQKFLDTSALDSFDGEFKAAGSGAASNKDGFNTMGWL